MELYLIRALLQSAVYSSFSYFDLQTLFEGDIQELFHILDKHHKTRSGNLSVEELFALYLADNPAITRAKRDSIGLLITKLKGLEAPNEEAAKEVLQKLHKQAVASKIANIAVRIANGQEDDLEVLKTALDRIQNTAEPDALTPIDNSINSVLEGYHDTMDFKFNLPRLAEQVPGIGGGIFTIIAARPEVGKTAFGISLIAAPDGFAHQGLKVAYIGNEEPVKRTAMRAITACTGMTLAEVELRPREAARMWGKIRENIDLIDATDLDISTLNAYIERTGSQILVIDQLDKLHVSGTFSRTDERLRELYTQSRELAKRHGVAIIAMSQISAEGEGRTNLSLDMLENSRTGKAAEADLVIAIGKNAIIDQNMRVINLLKNKLTGSHMQVASVLREEICRYET